MKSHILTWCFQNQWLSTWNISSFIFCKQTVVNSPGTSVAVLCDELSQMPSLAQPRKQKGLNHTAKSEVNWQDSSSVDSITIKADYRVRRPLEETEADLCRNRAFTWHCFKGPRLQGAMTKSCNLKFHGQDPTLVMAWTEKDSELEQHGCEGINKVCTEARWMCQLTVISFLMIWEPLTWVFPLKPLCAGFWK